MTTDERPYGFDRQAIVPVGMGTPKVCGKCAKWFAAMPRQRTCQGCLPNAKKSLKAASGVVVPGTLLSGRIKAGQRVVKKGFVEVYLDYLNLTFRGPVNDPRAPRLETIVLAYEEAARQRWEHKGHAPGERACKRIMHESPEVLCPLGGTLVSTTNPNASLVRSRYPATQAGGRDGMPPVGQ